MWGGLAWASGLSGILALLPFSSWIFQQSMYYRRALWILWGPSLSCQQSLLPGHEGISLFSLRPHASFHMAYLAPPIILWVLLQRLWNLIFAPGSLCWPLQELISIDVALSVSNKGQNSQSRPLIQLPPREFLKQIPRNSKSECLDPLLSIGGLIL